MERLELLTSRKLKTEAITPGLGGPNVQDGEALRAAISGALGAVGGSSRDVIVIVPDAAVRVLFLDFDALPAKSQDIEPMIRFRLKKSLPFDVEQAAVSYDIRRDNGAIRVVAAVSPRSIMEEYESAFRDAGYVPGVIVPSSLATLGLINGERPTLLLKVDPLNITIAGAQNQELRLIRNLENPHGTQVTASELADAVLPSIVFFEDTFAAQIEQICVGGAAVLDELGPMLHQQTGAEVRELAPKLSPEQNLGGETIDPSMMAGVAGALLG
jgi:type IV pilus assembly protein PilM